jgi:hypothetical protein
MPKTQIQCPQCHQLITATVEQLFDVTADPAAKQRLLGRMVNYAQCPYCGYEGPLSTPIVYHDAEKELLLTYFPPELNIPVNEQEKIIGPLITQITNRLPPEKRKAYLFQPQTFLTYQSMIERILAADGITPEMLKSQQDRVNLIERLITASSEDVRREILKQDAALVDEEFFALFGQLIQAAAASGQKDVVERMQTIEKQLLEETELGRKLQASVGELEAAAKSLQDAGNTLTREKLLDLLIEAPTEERRQALVSMARQGMDYLFFQELTRRIDAATGEEKDSLTALRERLLDYVNEIDQQIEARITAAENFIETILQAEDIKKAAREKLPEFTEDTIQVIDRMFREAATKEDFDRVEKLRQLVEALQELSAPPPEYQLLEELLRAPNDAALDKAMETHKADITDAFLQLVNAIIAESNAQKDSLSAQDKSMLEKMKHIYQKALMLKVGTVMK